MAYAVLFIPKASLRTIQSEAFLIIISSYN